MRILLYLSLLLFTTTPLLGQLSQADSLYKVGDFKGSATAYKMHIKEGFKNPTTLYQAAVAHAQIKDASSAILYLQKAIQHQYDDAYLSNIRFDLSLDPIKHTQQWKQFMLTVLAPFEEAAYTISHPEYRRELLELWKSDQYYRSLIFGKYNGRPPREVGNATEAVDRFNTARLEQIVDEIGWPTHSKVGKDGAHAAWNIVQHAVFNPPFMKRCLSEMEKAVIKNEVDGVDYAYLYDRFQAVCNLGQQRYGIVRNVPIETEYLVDQRRKKIGFKETLATYLNDDFYSPPSRIEWLQKDKKRQTDYPIYILKAKHHLSNKDFEQANEYYKKAMDCKGYIQIEDI